ncbi:hypothetical protein [Tomitella gaofuii]|uniref:hypothetical protein n=1 Tax=Tomitella gaofuii TaxID=2760083 RepID=UPI0015F91399|nr:hypothetical protein [Tomitella gaofuii]
MNHGRMMRRTMDIPTYEAFCQPYKGRARENVEWRRQCDRDDPQEMRGRCTDEATDIAAEMFGYGMSGALLDTLTDAGCVVLTRDEYAELRRYERAGARP